MEPIQLMNIIPTGQTQPSNSSNRGTGNGTGFKDRLDTVSATENNNPAKGTHKEDRHYPIKHMDSKENVLHEDSDEPTESAPVNSDETADAAIMSILASAMQQNANTDITDTLESKEADQAAITIDSDATVTEITEIADVPDPELMYADITQDVLQDVDGKTNEPPVLNTGTTAEAADSDALVPRETGNAISKPVNEPIADGPVNELADEPVDDDSREILGKFEQAFDKAISNTSESSTEKTAQNTADENTDTEQDRSNAANTKTETPINDVTPFTNTSVKPEFSVGEAAQANSGEAVERPVFQQIVERIMMSQADGNQELEIQLRPAHLGKVAIQLTLTAEGLLAKIMSPNPQVTSLLNSELTQLEETLRAQGIEVVSMDIIQDDPAKFDTRQQQFNEHQNQGSKKRRIFNGIMANDGIFKINDYLNSIYDDIYTQESSVDYKA